MMNWHLSRRAFLATAASAAALPRLAVAQPTNPDVVVIGAGAAGIAAARRLIASGKSVVVIEAADRIGGRAHTDHTTFGTSYDQGAAWLQGPSGLPHVDLARRQGYTLVDHDNAGEALFVGNRPADASEWAAYARANDRIEAAIQGAPDVSAASRLPADLPMSASAQSWIGPMDHGVDFADLSLGDVNSHGSYAYNFLIREGLGTLVADLGAGLPILTGIAARVVDWGGPGVRVETDRGTISAAACILTVSTGVLASGAIRFTPDLPPEKTQAIDDVPMGLLLKIALQFDGERFGMAENDFLTYAVPDIVPAPASYFLTWPTGSDLAVGFAGGAFGWELSAAGEAAAVDFALGAFVAMMGSRARSHFVKGHMSGWASNPLTLGAYSAARPGRHGSRAILGQPLGDRVFFAGEAVADRYHALVTGAHMSGEAAADAALAALGGPYACGDCKARAVQHEDLLETLE
jgi:monoamine oxidase